MKIYQRDQFGIIGGREYGSNLYIKNIEIDTAYQEAGFHSHPDTDEYYILLDGEIQFEHESGKVTLKSGETICFSKNERHRIVQVLTLTKVLVIKSANSVKE